MSRIIIPPQIPHYVPAPPTQAKLDYADLPVLDLSKSGTLEGRLALVSQLKDAMSNHGFFYVINHGYSKAQTERMFDIADVPFTQVTAEEKKTYIAKIKENGSYQGYKPRQYWHVDNGVRDQVEHYNFNRIVTKHQHPEPLRPFFPEIDAFARHNYEHVLYPILRLFALGLELPEETLVDLHGFDADGMSSVSFQKYSPRTTEDEVKTKNVWLKGHTDIGTVTILYSQPVAGLQMLAKDGSWKWIKYIENAMVINAGDSLQFLSGGYYKATIHRVVQPPPDQQGCTRLGLYCFTMTDDNVKLAPLVEQSPLLQRMGISKGSDDAPSMEMWRKGRTTAYGLTELKPAENLKGVEVEMVNGHQVRYYN